MWAAEQEAGWQRLREEKRRMREMRNKLRNEADDIQTLFILGVRIFY